VQEITGKSANLVFGYDEIDNFYSKAWEKYAEGDYYKALSILFDAGKLEGGTETERHREAAVNEFPIIGVEIDDRELVFY